MKCLTRMSVLPLLLIAPVSAFVLPRNALASKVGPFTELSVAMTPPEALIAADDDFILNKEETKPILRIGSGESEKIINSFGLWCAAVSLLTGPIWMAAMMLVNNTINKSDRDPHRSVYDFTGKIWARCWLSMTNSVPTVSGDLQQLRQGNGPCLYVANHASWLDIPVLCTVLDPVFKFIAKGELRKVPCIGQQLDGGNHILIDREDKRSQLRTFKDAISWLKQGVPIMAFPEGMRSKDGRLMDFKRGLFSLATKAGVPIVPITLSNTHAVMPSFSYFPVQSGSGKIHIHVGEPIDSSGRTEVELEELVRAEFVAHLPPTQQPIQPVVKVDEPITELQTA